MDCKVSLSTDMAIILLPTPTLSLHDYAPMGTVPPLPPPSPVGVAFEIPTIMYWPPGVLMGKTKLTSTVLHQGRTFALEGHDCGPAIIHAQIVPHILNVLTILHILNSKRKVNFSAGEVKADGTPIAHCILTNPMPTPMTSCGKPVSIPGTDSPTSHGNSVVIAVHIVDLIAGWLSIIVDVVWDYISSRGASAPDTTATTWGEAVEGELVDWFWGVLGEKDPFGDDSSRAGPTGSKFVRRNVTGNITGVVRLAGQLFGDYHGDARVGLSSGQGPLSVGVSYARDGDTHRNTVAATEGVSGPLGAGGVSAREQVQWGGSEGEGVVGSVRGTGNVGGAEGHGEYNTDDGWTGSGHWPAL